MIERCIEREREIKKIRTKDKAVGFIFFYYVIRTLDTVHLHVCFYILT